MIVLKGVRKPKKGHIFLPNQPLSICDKTAIGLKNFKNKDIFISNSSWHYQGDECW